MWCTTPARPIHGPEFEGLYRKLPRSRRNRDEFSRHPEDRAAAHLGSCASLEAPPAPASGRPVDGPPRQGTRPTLSSRLTIASEREHDRTASGEECTVEYPVPRDRVPNPNYMSYRTGTRSVVTHSGAHDDGTATISRHRLTPGNIGASRDEHRGRRTLGVAAQYRAVVRGATRAPAAWRALPRLPCS